MGKRRAAVRRAPAEARPRRPGAATPAPAAAAVTAATAAAPPPSAPRPTPILSSGKTSPIWRSSGSATPTTTPPPRCTTRREAHPPLVRPGQLGVRRTLGTGLLDFGSTYDLNGDAATSGASGPPRSTTARATRPSTGSAASTSRGRWVYTATSVEGPWSRLTTVDNAYHDAGLLIDDDDTMYVSSGTPPSAWPSSPPTDAPRSEQQVVSDSVQRRDPGGLPLLQDQRGLLHLPHPSGQRTVHPEVDQRSLRALRAAVLLDLRGPVSGGGVPHQGGRGADAERRLALHGLCRLLPRRPDPRPGPDHLDLRRLAVIQLVDGAGDASYPSPAGPAARPSQAAHGARTPSTADPEAQVGVEPQPRQQQVVRQAGLTLRTATVTSDLYAARNTLTRRIQGTSPSPRSSSTTPRCGTAMAPGSLLRDSSAWIGVKGRAARVVMANGVNMDTTGHDRTGTEGPRRDVSGDRYGCAGQRRRTPAARRHASPTARTAPFTSLGPRSTWARTGSSSWVIASASSTTPPRLWAAR